MAPMVAVEHVGVAPGDAQTPRTPSAGLASSGSVAQARALLRAPASRVRSTTLRPTKASSTSVVAGRLLPDRGLLGMPEDDDSSVQEQAPNTLSAR